MVRVSRWVAVLAAVAALTACSTLAPIQNVENVSVATSTNPSSSSLQLGYGSALMNHA